MNLWPLVAVFAAGVLVGLILAFLAAVVYALDDPYRPGRQRGTTPGTNSGTNSGMADDR